MKLATLLLLLLAVAARGAFAQNSNWQKMKDCGEQKEKVTDSKDGVLVQYEMSLRELIAKLSAQQSAPITLKKEYVPHYSQKYDMCFLEAVYTLNNVDRWNPRVDRTTSKLLINAFEGVVLADLGLNRCYLEGQKADCKETRAEIQDLMHH